MEKILASTQTAPYIYEYPHSAVATDLVVVSLKDGDLHTLLIRRGGAPFKGRWALPGGFLKMDETVEACARRELEEEAGLSGIKVFQFGIYSEPNRDPRERVISIAFFALAPGGAPVLQAGTDAADAKWYSLSSLPRLAFDHAKILEEGIQQMRQRSEVEPISALLLPDTFTMSDFQRATEILADRDFERRNFRRLKLEAGWVVATGQQRTGNHPPADLYRLANPWKKKYSVAVD